jgi:hypothetical protein
MQIQRVNRTDAEKVFINVKNGTGATITTGMGSRFLGMLAAETASNDGTQVTALDAVGNMAAFSGIAAQDIASLGFGRSQIWGFVDSIMFSAEADKTVGNNAIADTFLKPGSVAGTFTTAQTAQSLSTTMFKYVQVWQTVNISGGIPYGKGFVRGL